MFSRLHTALAVLLVAAVTGCSGHMNRPVRSTGFDPELSSSGSTGIVLTADQLSFESGSLLEAMSRHILSMKVDMSYGCPSLSLRGINTTPGVIEPVIYVDGAKTFDTCILDMMPVNDVERVEVYPSGVSHRSGLYGNTRGLIVIFTKR